MKPCFAITLITTLGIGCVDETMTRKVTLLAKPFWARGESAVLQDYVQVYACGLQPLIDSSSYVVWLVSNAQATPLGRLSLTTTPSIFALPASFDASLAADSLISEESGRTTYPDSPSQLTRLSGPLGGQLSYAPMCSECLTGVSGTADIADDWIQVSAMTAPALPPGLSYGVWATWAGAASSDSSMPGMQMAINDQSLKDAGHATTTTGSGACSFSASSSGDAAVSLEQALIGSLDASGMLTATAAKSLVSVSEIVVTIESARAAPDLMSPVAALRGSIVLPQPTESVAHTH